MTERSQTLTVAGQVTVVRLSTFNDVFTLRVKWMKVHDKWRDQFDQSVTKITPEKSIQTRVVVVDSKTKETPIWYQVVRVIGIVRNHIVSLLPKFLNKDGSIPT